MKLISNTADLSGMDCHLHSRFSMDAKSVGADDPQRIADTVRSRGLRGFIVTDHIDIGHWGGYIIDFDDYFSTWEKVRRDNPDLVIYIGLELGFEVGTAQATAELVRDLPIEYVINSVHYWQHPPREREIEAPYAAYLDAIIASLDAPYEYNTIGHLGFLERYIDTEMKYREYKSRLDEIIEKAVKKGVRFEENTNGGGVMRLPRESFLRAYKTAGGVRPILGSDAHISGEIGHYFDEGTEFLDKIF